MVAISVALSAAGFVEVNKFFAREAVVKAIKEKLTDPDQITRFIKDIDGSDELLDAVAKKTDLIDSWKKIDNSKLSNRRTDTNLLNDVDNFSKNFKQPAGVNRIPVNSNPPYKFRTSTGYEVQFDASGFPDFRDFSPGKEYSFKSNKLVGNATNDDFMAATDFIRGKYPGKVRNVKGGNFEMEIDGEWKKYTWHHHQDGNTLMPVLFDVHSATLPHTGGASIIKNNLQGMYDSPF